MDNTLYLLAAAMDYAKNEQERIANNLANAQTPGFKEVLSTVENLKTEDMSPQAIPYYRTEAAFCQGALEKSGDSLDIAIQGEGFFALDGKDGKRYMRSGHLMVDAEGYLANAHGLKLSGEDGPIKIERSKVSQLQIDKNGNIFADSQTIGKLKLVSFSEPSKLISQEGVYVNVGGMEAKQTDQCQVHQGYLEKSTVETIQSMTDMIANLRYLEAMQKITRVIDEGWQNLATSG